MVPGASLIITRQRRGALLGEHDSGARPACLLQVNGGLMNLTTIAQVQPSAAQDDNMPTHSPLSRADDVGPLFTIFMPVSFALVVLAVSWLSIISF